MNSTKQQQNHKKEKGLNDSAIGFIFNVDVDRQVFIGWIIQPLSINMITVLGFKDGDVKLYFCILKSIYCCCCKESLLYVEQGPE